MHFDLQLEFFLEIERVLTTALFGSLFPLFILYHDGDLVCSWRACIALDAGVDLQEDIWESFLYPYFFFPHFLF